jgi:hypothetical protein
MGAPLLVDPAHIDGEKMRRFAHRGFVSKGDSVNVMSVHRFRI